jgi:kynurenine formamidase
MVIRLLSHPLSPSTPTYPGTPGTTFTPASRIADRDTSNWLVFTTQNHAATHVDGPWHFNPHGLRITEIEPTEFLFTSPAIIDIPKGDDEVITADELAAHAAEIAGHDMLLVRTGYGRRWRSDDPERFRHHGPGFHGSAGEYLIREQLSVRAVAMDFISAAAQVAAADGIEFHRTVLGRQLGDRYIFLVEDARIDADLGPADLGFVVMAPLLLEGQDGGQVTMLAVPPSFNFATPVSPRQSNAGVAGVDPS